MRDNDTERYLTELVEGDLHPSVLYFWKSGRYWSRGTLVHPWSINRWQRCPERSLRAKRQAWQRECIHFTHQIGKSLIGVLQIQHTYEATRKSRPQTRQTRNTATITKWVRTRAAYKVTKYTYVNVRYNNLKIQNPSTMVMSLFGRQNQNKTPAAWYTSCISRRNYHIDQLRARSENADSICSMSWWMSTFRSLMHVC